MGQQSVDLFQKACGAAGPLELQATGPSGQPAGHLAVQQPFALIGRDPANDFCLDDQQVSQRHAYVQVIAGRVFCVDLGSRTGIRCAGAPGPSGWLDPGQPLEIGPFALRLANAATVGTLGANAPGSPGFLGSPLEARAADYFQLPAATLEFANGLTRQSRWRLNRALTLVGRAPGCKLQLADVSVSRYHCAILGTPDGVWVIDLLGKDGTRVNGARIRFARLDNGDRLQVGKFLIRLWLDRLTQSVSAPVLVSSLAAAPRPQTGVGERGAGPAEQGAAEESVLAPLTQQFQHLRQRTFDEFHQTMLVMMQMLNTLQRERMAPVREDLDQVYQLTLELQSLHAEQAKPSPSVDALRALTRPDSPAAPLPETQSPAAIQGWLSQRIAALQQERQSRWHKVLDSVLR
jgi:pSer/pThr/pTyr-binding forkhead associated (FHA) protein